MGDWITGASQILMWQDAQYYSATIEYSVGNAILFTALMNCSAMGSLDDAAGYPSKHD
jgi:hypothetical protein